ncbi:hypothetical protein HII13_002664 [Brettanomyces bruxellensis]|uniref:Probable metalloprotease ARX1 n=1 Tax=Dekkera bruxellensis TaxID=5007 RepID=A0A8H6BGN7_DEKBR|nr:uncharacterized protein BRETT_002311 [Brettanomyces bruxellensis]KAF6011306.1 hypothetical protein HII13_002664 [Brettanomyces bruxellensis]QOU22140.1 hypothetical protein BRETT_002311 [Brettanomyces bruxellensis]
MSLQISSKEAEVLLKQKNVLNEYVLEKYKLAGRISQTCVKYLVSLINNSYHLQKLKPYTAAELCILGDSYMKSALNDAYDLNVKEKGIAQPVTIDVNDVLEGYSPEVDDTKNITFHPGDVVTINVGCQIDGYTSRLAHTIVIYPPGLFHESTASLQPTGPLLGDSADAICATHIATETIIALLGCSLTPEKLPKTILANGHGNVTGSLIREITDSIAGSFHCIVVPGSKVRRIRRFLAGQAEGIVAERDFKGVVWSEADQEQELIRRSAEFVGDKSRQVLLFDKDRKSKSNENRAGTVPSDEFTISPGEVYTIDIRMAPVNAMEEPGIVTLEVLDEYSGKNNVEGELHPKPSIFLRDVAITYQLKLKSARRLLSRVDKLQPVYPFKLSEVSAHFPLNLSDVHSFGAQISNIHDDMKPDRLGLAEMINQRLVVPKPIWAVRFIPLKQVLKGTSSTGARGYDAENPTLPGMELPLPKLGISALQLKSSLKYAKKLPAARELNTIVIDETNKEILRLSGGIDACKPSWVHSNYQLTGLLAQCVSELNKLSQDPRFGLKIKVCEPLPFTN